MRVILVTGKGGVGKTSVAAATAVRAARHGHRTLVMSTDPAHSLGDALDVRLGDDPVEVAPSLEAEQLDPHVRLERHWADVRDYLVALLRWGGLEEVQAEELSLLPGLEELFALIDVRRHAAAGRHDVLVVDCAPTAETLRLLSLPDALGWYLERAFGFERTYSRVVRPLLGRMTSMPLPSDAVTGSAEGLYRALGEVRDLLLDDTRTTVRLVTNAERVVVAETRRTYTALGLFGYHVDAVVCNRLLPDVVDDPYLATWRRRQAAHLAEIRADFDTTVLTAPMADDEVVGLRALDDLADALHGDDDPAALLRPSRPLTIDREGDDVVLRIMLPFASAAEVDVHHRADELYVRAGAHTRSLVLPALLRRGQVRSASLADGCLEVRFAVPERNGPHTPAGRAPWSGARVVAPPRGP